MFFSDREKMIYEAPSGGKYDPLRVRHLLTVYTQNRLKELILARNNANAVTGDISKQGKSQAAIDAAEAELTLAEAARKAFQLSQWMDGGPTDGEVLETLYHYLGYMEGKDLQAGTPQSTPVTEFELRQGLMESLSH